MAFAPDYVTIGALLHLLHGGGRRRVHDRRVQAGLTRILTSPIRHRGGMWSRFSTRSTRPTTAASCSSAQMATSTSVPGTAVQRIQGIKFGAAQNLEDLTGQDSPHRSARSGRGRVHDPAGQPLRRPAAQARRDLVVRPAQPKAVLVRPADGRPHGRGRGPEPVGGDRLQSARLGLRSRRELRLELPRGPTRLRRSPSAVFRAAASGLHRARLGVPTFGRAAHWQLDRWWLRDPRPGAAGGLRPLRLRRLLQRLRSGTSNSRSPMRRAIRTQGRTCSVR